jgi:hypothetical protein
MHFKLASPSPSLSPARRRNVRQFAAGACALVGLAAIGAAFWEVDLKYSAPTPVPALLAEVELGTRLELPADLERFLRSAPGPTLLHFFNPRCPCSRFNLEHVIELARRFEGRARVLAVLAEGGEVADAVELVSEHFPARVDVDGKLAEALGVYSTPQAAIVGQDLRLYWRGNYNRTRYCVERTSEYARIALEAALEGRPAPSFDPRATLAYGCELPGAGGEPR